MSTILFLSLRALHVLLGAVWLGAAVLITLFLAPTVAEAGPAGGQIMVVLMRRGLHRFIAGVSVATVVTGLYLYWRFTGGFDPETARTPAGVAFGIGGFAGLGAALLGGAVVSGGSVRLTAIMSRAMGLPEGSEHDSLLRTAEALRQQIASASRIVIGLIVVALVLMAVGHYV